MKMEGSSFSISGNNNSRFLNPWVLNFQKLGLELKCPLCLCLLNRPVLLPCNHVFCLSCVPGSADCSVCNAKFVEKDLRHVPFLDNMATIYKCLDATFSANLIQSAANPEDERNTSHSPASTNIKFKETNILSPQCRAIVEMGANPVAQSAPDSPPSFGDAKGSDNDSPFQCSERIAENSLLKRGRNEHSRIGKHSNNRSGLDDDDTFRGVKRQKQLTYGPGQSNTNKADQTHVGEVSGISTPSSDMKLQTWESPRSNTGDCAFCHSSKISEDSGVMLHFLNEKLVDGEEVMNSSVIHVHKLCIDWAPQVYYVEDKAKNLKAEVARGAKLKCSKCGQKGAALGCYMKSCRRSYHIPCALKISKCRWDNAQFLMLCASHSAIKFPNEKKSGKNVGADHAKPAPVGCLLPSPTVTVVPEGEKKWILCGSALSTEDKTLMVKFGKMNGSTVSKYWNPNVTHVIAATDESGACTRTLKVLMAILNGRWVVKVDWIKACIEAKSHVDEEPFEVCLDNYGCRDSPKNGRIRAANDEPKLFTGMSFYFVGDFAPLYLEDLQDLVIAAGGTLVKSREEILALKSSEQALVVYNIDSPEGSKLGQEVSILWKRMSEAEDVARQTASKVVGHTWLLESIAGYKLQPVC